MPTVGFLYCGIFVPVVVRSYSCKSPPTHRRHRQHAQRVQHCSRDTRQKRAWFWKSIGLAMLTTLIVFEVGRRCAVSAHGARDDDFSCPSSISPLLSFPSVDAVAAAACREKMEHLYCRGLQRLLTLLQLQRAARRWSICTVVACSVC